MNINMNSVNPVGSDIPSVEYNVAREVVDWHHELPPPYSPRLQSDGQTPVIHQTIIVQAPLRDSPMYYICPRCQERVLTKVKYVSSKKTHMLAGFICGLTLWCLICCLAALPYYLSVFKSAQHFCPNCDELLGTYSKI